MNDISYIVVYYNYMGINNYCALLEFDLSDGLVTIKLLEKRTHKYYHKKLTKNCFKKPASSFKLRSFSIKELKENKISEEVLYRFFKHDIKLLYFYEIN